MNIGFTKHRFVDMYIISCYGSSKNCILVGKMNLYIGFATFRSYTNHPYFLFNYSGALSTPPNRPYNRIETSQLENKLETIILQNT